MRSKQDKIRILPVSEEQKNVKISYSVTEYRYEEDGEVKDVEFTKRAIAVVPVVNVLTWIDLMDAMDREHVEAKVYYKKEIVSDDIQQSLEWAYFTKVEDNRLLYPSRTVYSNEMLLYYIKDLDRYVMIRLYSHHGQLI